MDLILLLVICLLELGNALMQLKLVNLPLEATIICFLEFFFEMVLHLAKLYL